MRPNKFKNTLQNWVYKSDEEKKRMSEMASDLVLMYMCDGDSKSVACRRVTFDLSISTKLVAQMVRDNELINKRSREAQFGKKKLLRLDYGASLKTTNERNKV